MPLHEWIDVAVKVTGSAADLMFDDEILKVIVHAIERFVLVGLLLWLGGKLAVLLWRHRAGDGERMLILFA